MIAFEGAGVAHGPVVALHPVTLEIPAGALAVLVGPSGAGKSTLLRLVNRLVAPTTGRVRIRGQDIAGVDPAGLRRSIGYAIQSVGLFPHRTVAANIATVPRLLGWPRARIAARVAELLALMRLDPGLGTRLPAALSGGQAQRVGLARALAADPDILLMDEPFGAVDPIVRRALRAELRTIHAATAKTILLVTHDPAEALELASLLVVLRDGHLVAAGAPLALTDAGADPFVRALFGAEDLGLRRLALRSVATAMTAAPLPGAPAVEEGASLRAALARMLETGRQALEVRSAAGVAVGSVTLAGIMAGAAAAE